MHWGHWVMMILGWGCVTIVLCAKIVTRSIDGPCPKLSIKCWIAVVIAICYGVAWYFLMGLKNGFVSTDYFISTLIAASVGTAVARVLCPTLLDK
jgi:hypothetical protein